MVALLCFLFWVCSEPAKDPTQCDILDSTPLIEEVAKVEFIAPLKEPDPTPSPQPSPSDKHEATKREILVFLAPKGQKCPPCEQWKDREMKRFMDANWEVAIFDGPHNYGRTPTFELKSGDKKVTLTGYTTLEQAAEALR